MSNYRMERFWGGMANQIRAENALLNRLLEDSP